MFEVTERATEMIKKEFGERPEIPSIRVMVKAAG